MSRSGDIHAVYTKHLGAAVGNIEMKALDAIAEAWDDGYRQANIDGSARRSVEFVDLVAARLGVTLRNHGITTQADWDNLVEVFEEMRTTGYHPGHREALVRIKAATHTSDEHIGITATTVEAWAAVLPMHLGAWSEAIGHLWPNGGTRLPDPTTVGGRAAIVDAIRVLVESSQNYIRQLSEMRQQINQYSSAAIKNANLVREIGRSKDDVVEENERLKNALAGERARGRRDILRDLRKAAAKADEDARATAGSVGDQVTYVEISQPRCEGGC